jgi:hypothetical protein
VVLAVVNAAAVTRGRAICFHCPAPARRTSPDEAAQCCGRPICVERHEAYLRDVQALVQEFAAVPDLVAYIEERAPAVKVAGGPQVQMHLVPGGSETGAAGATRRGKRRG